MPLQKFRLHPATLCMSIVVVAACILRLYLINSDWPNTNGDEAIIDLMALHISRGQHWPIFFYGQGYMGVIQAYLGAGLYPFLGVSVFAVRVGLVLVVGAFLLVMYALSSLLYSRWLGVFVLLCLCFGGRGVIGVQLFANGGYVETLLFGVLLFLLAARLAFSAPPGREMGQRPGIRRCLGYFALGLVAGLAIYTLLLIAPTILAIVVLLWLYCRFELRSRAGWYLLGGLLVGILPVILYNITAPAGMDSIHAFFGSTGFGASHEGVSFGQQLLHVFLITLPNATGVAPLCMVNEPMQPVSNILLVFGDKDPLTCVLRNGSWSLGYMTLWTLSFVITARPLWRVWRSKPQGGWTYEERREAILLTTRALLLLSVFLSLTLYAIGRPAAVNPRSAARYLVCMILAAPALLWPLWNGLERVWRTREKLSWPLWGQVIGRGALLLAVLGLFVGGTLNIFEDVPNTQGSFRQQRALVDTLLKLDVSDFYSEYWTCYRLVFFSQEKLVCANLDEKLQIGFNRYPPYVERVQESSKSRPLPYVFRENSEFDKALQQKLALDSSMHYQRQVQHGYAIYLPEK